MDDLDYWRILDEFSVTEALLLVVGVDPFKVNANEESFKQDDSYNRYVLIRRKLIKEFESSSGLLEEISFKEGPLSRYGSRPLVPNWDRTKVSAKAMRLLLRETKISSKFFESYGQPGYLDPEHDHYSPKLAAAVGVWLAMEDKSAIGYLATKKVLNNWLTKHASEFRDKKGKQLSNNGISECSAVANWDTR